MSSRNLVYESLVIRARESPGGSRVLTLMTAEAGLVDAFVFGGPKSKLRSIASPYVFGRAFVYLDPVKDYRKLSDFEARDSYPALREELGKLWGAGLVAELLMKTSGGGGDFHLVLELATDCLRALDAARGGDYDYPILAFCWRLVELLGLGPDPSACATCGSDIRPGAGAAFSFEQGGFVCPSCSAREAQAAPGAAYGAAYPGAAAAYGAAADPSPRFADGDARASFVGSRAARLVRLGPAALRWLEAASSLPLGEASGGGLERPVLDSLKALVYGLVKCAADAPLKSFSAGAAFA